MKERRNSCVMKRSPPQKHTAHASLIMLHCHHVPAQDYDKMVEVPHKRFNLFSFSVSFLRNYIYVPFGLYLALFTYKLLSEIIWAKKLIVWPQQKKTIVLVIKSQGVTNTMFILLCSMNFNTKCIKFLCIQKELSIKMCKCFLQKSKMHWR